MWAGDIVSPASSYDHSRGAQVTLLQSLTLQTSTSRVTNLPDPGKIRFTAIIEIVCIHRVRSKSDKLNKEFYLHKTASRHYCLSAQSLARKQPFK